MPTPRLTPSRPPAIGRKRWPHRVWRHEQRAIEAGPHTECSLTVKPWGRGRLLGGL